MSQWIHGAALALALWALLDWTRNRGERWFLLGAIAVCGLVVAAFGIVLKIQGTKQVPWSEALSDNFFASFVYHGHAAAFLGLCWPAALVLAIRSLQSPGPLGRSVWINVFLLLFASLFVNLSKFGHLVAFPGLLLALLLGRRGLRLPGAGVSPVVVIVGGGLVLGAVLMLVGPFWGASAIRWERLLAAGEGGRPFIYRVCWDMIRAEPWFGFGLGSFRWAFPFYTGAYGDPIRGTVTHAHQDFLQTVVEWGLLGSFGWGILTVGGLVRGWGAHRRQAEELSVVAALTALGITLVHGMVDFPFQTGAVRLYSTVYLAILWRVRPDRRDAVG
jgi:O-antigen ligase